MICLPFLIFKNTDILQVNFTEGIGSGILYPKTNTTLLQKKTNMMNSMWLVMAYQLMPE